MSKSRISVIAAFFAVFMTLLSMTAFANARPVFEIHQITASGGEGVRVPVSLSGNEEGICGATLTVEYDRKLTLTGVERGEALTSLTMTKPGNVKENPVNIVWDGMEADSSNGVIAYLIFTVPETTGTYPITLSYIEGDILDGSIASVDAVVKSGSISTVGDVTEEETGITMQVNSVTAKAGETVDVPVSISGNTGICGATITVSYDRKLTLGGVKKGDALTSLTMTKPGKMEDNPVNIVFDGMEADSSNGVMAYLTFTAPDAEGTYPISISYIEGDILDADVKPVSVKMIDGAITVGSGNSVTVTASGKSVTLINNTTDEGIIFIAYYDSMGNFLSLEKRAAEPTIAITNPYSGASQLKAMWWKDTDGAKPLCDVQKISLK